MPTSYRRAIGRCWPARGLRRTRRVWGPRPRAGRRRMQPPRWPTWWCSRHANRTVSTRPARGTHRLRSAQGRISTVFPRLRQRRSERPWRTVHDRTRPARVPMSCPLRVPNEPRCRPTRSHCPDFVVGLAGSRLGSAGRLCSMCNEPQAAIVRRPRSGRLQGGNGRRPRGSGSRRSESPMPGVQRWQSPARASPWEDDRPRTNGRRVVAASRSCGVTGFDTAVDSTGPAGRTQCRPAA